VIEVIFILFPILASVGEILPTLKLVSCKILVRQVSIVPSMVIGLT